jgi:hypothetical protein
MRKFMIALVLLSFVSVGCTGSFMLTKKVYNWHRSMGDKWGDEFGFLVCVLLPVYGISTFADAVIFNSVEFWTGNNPVSTAQAPTATKFVKAGDGKAMLSYNNTSKELRIASQKKGLHPTDITLVKNGDSVVTKDKNGNVLFTTVKDGNGGFLVYNKNQQLVRNYSPKDIRDAQEKFLR